MGYGAKDTSSDVDLSAILADTTGDTTSATGAGSTRSDADTAEDWDDRTEDILDPGPIPDTLFDVPGFVRDIVDMKVDYLIISHPHDDHAGAVYTADGLPDHIGIGQAYYNGAYNASWSDPQRLEKVMAAHDIPLQAISAGFTLDIGDVRLQVISPEPDVIGQTFKTTPDVNNSSIVLRMDYGDFSALFTGDIYQLQEMELVRNAADLLDADLLKMPHHGNSTSNSKKFADAVKPQLAVATGRLVIDAMQYYVYTKNGAKVLFDYCDGYIHVYTDGEKITWEHSRERTIDFYDKYEYENLMAVN